MEIASELISKNNISDGHVYMQVTRGSAPRHIISLNQQFPQSLRHMQLITRDQ